MTAHLHRELAPVSERAWEQIEAEAKDRLETHLAARKLVDFTGPHGWAHSSSDLGRVAPIDTPSGTVRVLQRRVLPLVEVRATFVLSRSELDDVDRGSADVDLGPLEEAARQIALAENTTVFEGLPEAGMAGIRQSSAHPTVAIPGEMDAYPTVVARATDILRQSGVGGPYGMAISPGIFTRIVETAEHGGHLLLDHLRKILDGPVVWAPGVPAGVVLSLRGGDFVLECGQDISVGYASHDTETLNLYLEESFSFRVLDADAAVVLTAS